MKYSELFDKYQKLLAENERLKIENDDFRKRLGLTSKDLDIKNDAQATKEADGISYIGVSELAQINNNSLPEDKISLFMSLCVVSSASLLTC